MTQYVTRARRRGRDARRAWTRGSRPSPAAPTCTPPLRPGTDGALAWGLIQPARRDAAPTTGTSWSATRSASRRCRRTPRRSPREAVETGDGRAGRHGPSRSPRPWPSAAPRVAVYVGNGLEHHENGVNNIRAIAMPRRPAGRPGPEGGTVFKAALPLRDLTAVRRACRSRELGPIGAERFPVLYDLRQECHTMTAMDAILSGRALSAEGDDRHGGQPGHDQPQLRRRSREALEALDLLVVRDLFMTETAALADYVLPAASFLERTELHVHAKHQVVTLTRKLLVLAGRAGRVRVLARPGPPPGRRRVLPLGGRDGAEPLAARADRPHASSELAAHPEGLPVQPIRHEKLARASLWPRRRARWSSPRSTSRTWATRSSRSTGRPPTGAPRTRNTPSCWSPGRASCCSTTAASRTSSASPARDATPKWKCIPTTRPAWAWPTGSRRA